MARYGREETTPAHKWALRLALGYRLNFTFRSNTPEVRVCHAGCEPGYVGSSFARRDCDNRIFVLFDAELTAAILTLICPPREENPAGGPSNS